MLATSTQAVSYFSAIFRAYRQNSCFVLGESIFMVLFVAGCHIECLGVLITWDTPHERQCQYTAV